MTCGPHRSRHAAVRRAATALGAVLLAACAGGESASRAPRQPVRVGAAAPAYRIATFAGDSLVIGASPSVVLLNVWATWCASCKEEFALMDTLLARHGPAGLRVVAVSVDVGSSEPVHRTVAEYAVTFEVAHDAEGDVERRFPAMGVPASYLIGRDGTLLWKHVGVLPAAVDTVIARALAPANVMQ
jgi:cytochrome c biogenesis protein CcmG, thiol:disulfide interchange protein DsbE